VTARYVLPEFASRVVVLAKMGCTEAVGAEHSLTLKGGVTAQRIQAIQRLCGIERSGLYGGQEDQSSCLAL
jgi:hypothetical protein